MRKINEGFQKINKILQTPITFGKPKPDPENTVLPKWIEGTIYSLPQDSEIGLQVARGKSFCSRYAFARSTDTQDYGDISEDYLVFNQDREKFVFTLCDGVGQSFFGDLAAKYLGDSLAQWLWKFPNQAQNEAALNFRLILKEFLKALVPEADQLIKIHPLPSNIPGMLRDVLEQKRAFGSETIFAAGRIDLPSPTIPQGCIILTWMGDCRMRLWNFEQSGLICLGGEFKTEQRWSTTRGLVRGEPYVFTSPFIIDGKPVFSLLEVYSDGLNLLDDYQARPVLNPDIERLIKQAQSMPTSDDISYLAVYATEYLKKKPY